jgi:predicted nuclease of predicted toxin-antitoxin system
MPEAPLNLLFDQNIPQEVTVWMREQCPTWVISHVREVGLSGRPDSEIFQWAQSHQRIVITYDEDFADTRSFPLGSHHGVIRLRVWPTTIEMTKAAIERLISQVPSSDWNGSLIIIHRENIRLRKKP